MTNGPVSGPDAEHMPSAMCANGWQNHARVDGATATSRGTWWGQGQGDRVGTGGHGGDRGTWWGQGDMVGTGAGGHGGDRGTWWGQGQGDIGAG